MRITKFLHSCVLLEHDGACLLFDPGRFSCIEERVRADDFGPVSCVVVTHGHPDHVESSFLKEILTQQQVPVFGNTGTAEQLGRDGISVEVHESGTRQVGPFMLRAVAAVHEPILADELPQNTAYVVNDLVLNPGDSFAASLDLLAGTPVLLLPVMAPWGTELDAMSFAMRLRPRDVIPVHDGQARDFFLHQRYATFTDQFARRGVAFHGLAEPGASVNVA